MEAATKQDLLELETRMTTAMRDIVGDAAAQVLQATSEEFQRVYQRLDKIERKLDATRAIDDQHSTEILILQRKMP